jgi:hypothetical protein
MGYWVAQAQQYKDTSPPPRERKRRPEAGFVLLDTSSQALGALSLQNDTIIRHTPAPDAIEEPGRTHEKSRVAILGGGIRCARPNDDQIVVSRRACAYTANE